MNSSEHKTMNTSKIGRFFLLGFPLLLAMGFLAFSVLPNVCFAQALATGTAPAQPSFGEVLSRMMPMFALVFMIYYFMIVKPQQLKAKNQADLSSSLKKGDSIVTTGGIFGRVSSVEADSLSLEVSPNVKIKIELAHVARKIEAEAGSAGAKNAAVNSNAVSRVK